MQPMHPKTTRAMATAYGFDVSKNAEIRGSWYRLCLQAGAPPAGRPPAPGKWDIFVIGRSSRQLLSSTAPCDYPIHTCSPEHKLMQTALLAHCGAEDRASQPDAICHAGDTAVHEQTVAFLKEQGRMKYLRPLYKALAASGAQGATLAQVTRKHGLADRIVRCTALQLQSSCLQISCLCHPHHDSAMHEHLHEHCAVHVRQQGWLPVEYRYVSQ